MSTLESISPDRVLHTFSPSRIMNGLQTVSKKISNASESCVNSTRHAIAQTSSAIGHAWRVSVDTTSSKIKQAWETTTNTASSLLDATSEEFIASLKRNPVRDRAWVFKASFNKITTMIQGEQEDPTLVARQKIQDAIEGVFVKKDHEELMKNNQKFVNQLLPNGELPLNYAIKLKNKEFVQLLLENRADPEAPDRKGQNAITTAMLAENKEIIDILFNALLPLIMRAQLQKQLKNPEFVDRFMEIQKQGPKAIAILENNLMAISRQHLEIMFEESRYSPHNDELASSTQDYVIFSVAATVLMLDCIGYGEGSIASVAGYVGNFIQMSSLVTMIHEMVKEPQISGLLILPLILTKSLNNWVGTLSNLTINTLYAASIIETAKTVFSNMKTRPGASLRRLAIDSVNTYALSTKLFDRPDKDAPIKRLVDNAFDLPGKPKDTNFTTYEDCSTAYKNLYKPIKSGITKFLDSQLEDVKDPSKTIETTIRVPIETSKTLTLFNGLFDTRLERLVKQQCAGLPKEAIDINPSSVNLGKDLPVHFCLSDSGNKKWQWFFKKNHPWCRVETGVPGLRGMFSTEFEGNKTKIFT